MSSKNAGFTLLELIITISIAAILAAIGIPSLVNTVRNNRLATATNELTSALMYARSEAIKRNMPVNLCRSSDGATCSNVTGSWEIGWITYMDGNCNGSYDPSGPHPDPTGSCPALNVPDTIISVHEAVSGGLTISGNNNATNQIPYNSLGLKPGSMGALTITDGTNTRVICIGSSGRSRLMPRGTTACPVSG